MVNRKPCNFTIAVTRFRPRPLAGYVSRFIRAVETPQDRVAYGTVLESYSRIQALYEIRVFDGKTFDVIEKMAAPPLDDVGPVRLAGPSRTIDESFAPGTGDPVQNEKLHAAIADLVARSLSSTLSDMHLAETRSD